MFESGGSKFLRGLREPWDLMGRMRAEPRLWSRYWRTVLVQAALTLVAGLVVFWVLKQGADAWNDAFGPEEPPAARAPASATSAAPAPTGGAATDRSGAAPTGPSKPPGDSRPADRAPAPATTPGHGDSSGPSGSREAPGAPSLGGTPADGPPPEPDSSRPGLRPPTLPGKPSGSAALRKLPPPTAPPKLPARPADAVSSAPSGSRQARAADEPTAGAPPTEASRDGADDADPEDDEPAEDTGLEAEIKALQNAPAEERNKRTAELVAKALSRVKREATRAERSTKRKGTPEEATSDLADERDSLKDTIEELTLGAEALAREPPGAAGKARKARRQIERKLDEVEKDAGKLVKRGASPLSAAEQAQLVRARAALQVVRRHERGLAGRLGAVLALLAAIYASLGIAQTGVLALSRDFHDALSRDLSLLVHVAPEDPPLRPRIRLDVPWVRRKANRRAQFFLGFLPGTALIYVVGWLLPPHRTLTTVLTALWAAYWWTVMTAGQSARAWSPPASTPRPWYLRGWFALTDRFFLFRWAIPRAWGRLWERMARRFYGPSERVEEQPLEFAGLALSRALMLVPVLKLLFRPLFPVCAARLLVEHAATARLPVPVTAAEVADAAALAPDPEARAHSGAPAR